MVHFEMVFCFDLQDDPKHIFQVQQHIGEKHASRELTSISIEAFASYVL